MSEHRYDCVLTLALPAALEEEVLGHLQAHPEWVNGFSVVAAEGFGAGAPLETTIEQVRGRARRRLVTLLLDSQNVERLLHSLRGQFRSPHMAYWVTPLTSFGRFA
ncbi:MAG TPA: DUF3240 family protein [Noviherbaspirillum sp.]|nr:DUF3240 family protein [Noviherbaspirillum sp.]